MGHIENNNLTMPLPSLPALIHPATAKLIDNQREIIEELVHGLGSPLHFLLPDVFVETVKRFQQTMDAAGVDGFILYAKKANKGRCFVERCPELGIGIDAASIQEVEQALGCGVPNEHIGITGPAKHPALLQLALRQRCLVAIDSLEELQAFALLARRSDCNGRILLRCKPDSQPDSRFGMTPEEREIALQTCIAERDALTLEGLSFHLSGYSPQARATEAHRMIDACLDAQQRGLTRCISVNIGGGFAVRYAEKTDWLTFIEQQQPSHYHANKAFSNFYPYYSASHGAEMLADILASKLDQASPSLAQRLKRHAIRLFIEPGRALLDQAGFSAFQIQGVKDRLHEQGYGILTVSGTSFSLSEQWFNSEYLPDPVLLSNHPANGDDGDYAACVGGASCLDDDMLSWRKIRFPRRPTPGDLLLYLNTAGYQMDSNESPFHDLPLPRKVVLGIAHGKPRWYLDDRSAPVSFI